METRRFLMPTGITLSRITKKNGTSTQRGRIFFPHLERAFPFFPKRFERQWRGEFKTRDRDRKIFSSPFTERENSPLPFICTFSTPSTSSTLPPDWINFSIMLCVTFSRSTLSSHSSPSSLNKRCETRGMGKESERRFP